MNPTQNSHPDNDGPRPGKTPATGKKSGEKEARQKNERRSHPSPLKEDSSQSSRFGQTPPDKEVCHRRKSAPGKNRGKKQRRPQRVGKKKACSFREDEENQGQNPEDPLPGILPDAALFFGRDTGVGALDNIGHSVEMEGPGQGNPGKKEEKCQKKRRKGGEEPEDPLRQKCQNRAQKKPGQKKGLRPDTKGSGAGVDPPGDRKSRQKGECQKKPGNPSPKPFALFRLGRGRGIFGVGHPGPASETEASAKVAMRL